MEATNNFDNSAFMGEGLYGKVLSEYADFEKVYNLFFHCYYLSCSFTKED